MRHLHYKSPWWRTHMHIIGENNIDETAMLALGPRTKEHVDEPPDFVNTQAIYARALALTLAYPAVYPAIAEIFDSGVGATLSLRPAGLYVPLGAPLRWGVVQQRVVLGRRGDPEPGRYRQICIAILTAKNNHTIIGQADGALHAYEETDRLVVIERDLRPPPPEAAKTPKVAKTPKAAAPKARPAPAPAPEKPASPRVVPPPAVHRPPPMGTFSPPPKQTNDAPAAADPGPPPTLAKAAPYVPRSLRDLKKNSRGLPPPSGGLPSL